MDEKVIQMFQQTSRVLELQAKALKALREEVEELKKEIRKNG